MIQEETNEKRQQDAWLMSLALDQRLEPDEAELFDALIAHNPALGKEWALWQAMDAMLLGAPQVTPADGFVIEFERRREQAERRRRLWFGLGVATVTVALWCTLLLGLLGASAYLVFRESGLLVALVHGAAYWYAVVHSQLSALLLTATTLLSAPRFQAILLVYAMTAGLTLYVWVRFLRRSLRDAVNAQYSSHPS